MFDTARNLLLALLLLVGQVALTLHQIDFDQHAEGTECQVCLAAQGLDHALGLDFNIPALWRPAVAPLPSPENAPPIAVAAVFLARAPPPVPALS